MGNEKSREGGDVKLTPLVPKIIPFQSYQNLSSKVDGREIHKMKNYGFLPAGTILNILTYCCPKELMNCFSTCRFIYQLGSSNDWWREYYITFYLCNKEDFEEQKEEEQETINWKKRFFSRLSTFNDDFYHHILRTKTSKSFEKHYRPFIPTKSNYVFIHLQGYHTRVELIVAGDPKNIRTDFINSFLYEFDLDGKKKYENEEFKIERNSPHTVTSYYKSSVLTRLWDYDGPERTAYVNPGSEQHTYLGVFLCFSVHDKLSFESVKTKLQNDEFFKTEDPFEKYSTVYILVGVMENNENENEKKPIEVKDSEVKKFVKQINLSSRSRFPSVDDMKKKQIAGYVQCVPTRNKYNEGVVLAVGLLLDMIARRTRSWGMVKLSNFKNLKEKRKRFERQEEVIVKKKNKI